MKQCGKSPYWVLVNSRDMYRLLKAVEHSSTDFECNRYRVICISHSLFECKDAYNSTLL